MIEILERFFLDIKGIEKMIKTASYEKLQWADDDILDSITADLLDYLLYLSSDEIFVNELSNIQVEYLEHILMILFKYNHYLKDNGKNNLIFAFNILKDSYNSWFNDNITAREIKFPISYQERKTIPMSLQQLRCYDQKYHAEKEVLFCVYFYDI